MPTKVRRGPQITWYSVIDVLHIASYNSGAGNRTPGPLQEQQMLLLTEPSLQPHTFPFLKAGYSEYFVTVVENLPTQEGKTERKNKVIAVMPPDEVEESLKQICRKISGSRGKQEKGG